MEYPISRLNYSIMELLSSFEIVRNTVQNNGLKNDIVLTEVNDGHYVLSEINESGQVFLSPSFCQFIWNISYSALLVTDDSISFNILKQNNLNKEQFLSLIKEHKDVPEVNFLLSELNAMPWEDVLKAGIDCLKKNETPKTEQILARLDLSSDFVQRVNGVYRAAISFVLLHELFHWQRKHFRHGIKRIEMEKEADDYAFDVILRNSTDLAKKTNIIGSICTLISFFFINPLFSNDGNYPYEDERLFVQFDKVLGPEKDACRSIIVRILEIWARFFNVSGFPSLTNNDELDLKHIRSFLSSYMR